MTSTATTRKWFVLVCVASRTCFHLAHATYLITPARHLAPCTYLSRCSLSAGMAAHDVIASGKHQAAIGIRWRWRTAGIGIGNHHGHRRKFGVGGIDKIMTSLTLRVALFAHPRQFCFSPSRSHSPSLVQFILSML